MRIPTYKLGPTTIQLTDKVCGLCQYHKHDMIKSGLDPIYEHYCEHPDILREESRYTQIRVNHPSSGRLVGTKDRTPHWCPFMEDKNANQTKDQSAVNAK